MDGRPGLETFEERRFPFPCLETNHNSASSPLTIMTNMSLYSMYIYIYIYKVYFWRLNQPSNTTSLGPFRESTCEISEALRGGISTDTFISKYIRIHSKSGYCSLSEKAQRTCVKRSPYRYQSQALLYKSCSKSLKTQTCLQPFKLSVLETVFETRKVCVT